jgi:predicted metal-binding membrane protein
MDHATCLANHFEPRIARPARARAISAQARGRAFVGVTALFFIVTASGTVLWCNSMSAMQGMPMPGGWTMSMAWMRMPGQSWAAATASFLGMWVVMMAAMMLPSLVPMLSRYRQSLAITAEPIRDRLTALAGLGYFFVWTLYGLVIFPAGVAMATVEMKDPALARAIPVLSGLVVLMAGALQLTRWKAHLLACCREQPGHGCALPARASAAWRQGLEFGFRCGLSCANLTAVLLVLGVMDLRAMAAVTAAITAERLAPACWHVARAVGAVAVIAGLLFIA